MIHSRSKARQDKTISDSFPHRSHTNVLMRQGMFGSPQSPCFLLGRKSPHSTSSLPKSLVCLFPPSPELVLSPRFGYFTNLRSHEPENRT